MTAAAAIAIYFIIWWLALFLVLPWGVRNAHESGEPVLHGHEPGAPVNPLLGRKVLAATVLATLMFALVYGIVALGWIGFEDIPFLSDMPGA